MTRIPQRIQRRQRTPLPALARHVGRPFRWANPFDLVSLSDPEGGPPWAFIERVPRLTTLTGRTVVGDPTPFERALMRTRVYELHHATPVSEHAPYALDRAEVVRHLGGRDLACWCPLADEYGRRWPCHADVLLALANPDVHFPFHDEEDEEI